MNIARSELLVSKNFQFSIFRGQFDAHFTANKPFGLHSVRHKGFDGNDSIDLSGLGAILPNLEYITYFGNAGDDTIKLAPEAAFKVAPAKDQTRNNFPIYKTAFSVLAAVR